MSGLGFQNTNCSIANAVNAALSEIPEAAGYLHGERAGFGVICQLVFENAPTEEINTVLKFMTDIGLPVTLKQLDVRPGMDNIMKMADIGIVSDWKPIVKNLIEIFEREMISSHSSKR